MRVEGKMTSWTRRLILASALVCLMPGLGIAQQAGDRPGDVTGPTVEVDPGATPDRVAPASSTREQVTFLLSGYEYFPTRADLDAIAKAEVIAPLLATMLQDDAERPMIKLRALDALGYYGDEKTRALLRGIATSPVDMTSASKKALRMKMSMRHHAIVSLAKAGKDAELKVLVGLFSDEDVQIRLTTISAIGKNLGEPGKAALRELDRKTDDPIIARELRKHL